jgi:hypothetical protein
VQNRETWSCYPEQKNRRGAGLLILRDFQFLQPWIKGALIWFAVSLIVVLEHLKTGSSDNLFDFCLLLSLLWVEFGFAGIFHTLLKEQGRKIVPLLLITTLPPLLLFIVGFYAAWRAGMPLQTFSP